MEKQIGGILKLNRIQKDYPLKCLSSESGLSIQYINRVERNKEKITDENLEKLFRIMGIEMCDEDIDEQFEKDFMKFYENVYYIEDFQKSYQAILSYQDRIQSTCSYVKYLLAEMIYEALVSSNVNVKPYTYLQDYFEYLEEYQKQLYFDYIGLILRENSKEKESIYFYETALQYKGTDYSKAMVNYHLSTGLTKIGEYQEALESAYIAREIFAKTVNIRRLASLSFQIATTYSRNRQYQEAEQMFIHSNKSFQLLGMESSLKTGYNNMLWHYIRCERYEKITLLEKEALQITDFDHRIYFYLSYAYHKLGNEIKAKECIKNAKKNMQNPTCYMKTMIHAFSIYLSHADNDRKEKQLLLVKKKAQQIEDIDLIVFAEKLLRDYYRETNQNQKYYESVEKLLKFYEI